MTATNTQQTRPTRPTSPSTLLRERAWCVVDVETTGFSAQTESIIEIALVRVEHGRITERWATLINAHRDPGATHIHGITADMLRDAPIMGDVAAAIAERLQGCIFVAHNVDFDLPFIEAELNRNGITMPNVQTTCTLKAARKHLKLESNKLGSVCDHYGIDLTNAHSALDDAEAAARVCAALCKTVESKGLGRIAWHDSINELVPTDQLSVAATHRR